MDDNEKKALKTILVIISILFALIAVALAHEIIQYDKKVDRLKSIINRDKLSPDTIHVYHRPTVIVDHYKDSVIYNTY